MVIAAGASLIPGGGSTKTTPKPMSIILNTKLKNFNVQAPGGRLEDAFSKAKFHLIFYCHVKCVAIFFGPRKQYTFKKLRTLKSIHFH